NIGEIGDQIAFAGDQRLDLRNDLVVNSLPVGRPRKCQSFSHKLEFSLYGRAAQINSRAMKTSPEALRHKRRKVPERHICYSVGSIPGFHPTLFPLWLS